jgi:hypothetical protein
VLADGRLSCNLESVDLFSRLRNCFVDCTCLRMGFDLPTDRLVLSSAVLRVMQTAISVAVAFVVFGHTKADAAVEASHETGSSSSTGAERLNAAPSLQPEPDKPQLWSFVAEDTLSAPDRTRRIESGNYRTLRLNRNILAELLAGVPPEGAPSDVVMELPWPDGTFLRFRIQQVDAGPAALCPDRKVYRGKAIDDTLSSVRFDWSSSGLHGLIQSSRSVVHIAPYAPGDTEHYIVYHARDWRPGPEQSGAVEPAQPPVVSPPGQPGPPTIKEITLERACFGCEVPYRLTFRNDGRAIATIIGVRRFGTVDHTCTGTVMPDDFEHLAALMEREGFFDLNESYRNPRLEDGQWVTISALRDGRRKAVLHSNQVGPPQLKVLEDAIDALTKKVVWEGRRP